MNVNDRSAGHEKWQNLVEEQENSGLSQKEFCKQQNLILSQFVYYRSRLKKKERSDQSNSDVFVPIKINSSSTLSFEVRIVLPNRFQCYFPCHLEPSQIKRFMEVLLSC